MYACQAYNSLGATDQQLDRKWLRKLLLIARKGENSPIFVKRILSDMSEKYGFIPEHFEYHALMYAYGVQKQPQLAYNVLDTMRANNLQPNLFSYNTLLGCYKRSKDVHGCERVFEEMEESSIQPDTATFNTLMDLWAKNNQPEKVFELYKTSMKKGIVPDIYTLSTVLHLAIKENNMDIGNGIYNRLLKSTSPKDIDLTVVNTMLNFKANVDLEEVITLYKDIKTKFPHLKPDRITYNTVMDASLKNNNIARVYMVFKEMKAAHINPDIVTFGIMMDAESKLGNLRNALKLFQELCQSPSIEPNERILTSMANMAASKSAQLGDINELLRLTEEHSGRLKLDTKAYNALMYGLARNGRSEQVQYIYDTVFRSTGIHKPDIATFTSLIVAYMNDNGIDEGMEIYYTLREHHKRCQEGLGTVKIPIRLDTTFYSTLIGLLSINDNSPATYNNNNGESSSPRLLAALNLFNDMRTLQIQPSKHNYTAMLHACGQYRDSYVLEHIHKLIKVDLCLDPDTGIYNALMDAYNRTGDGDTVIEIWEALTLSNSSTSISPDQTTVSILFDGCGYNNLGDRAKRVWQWLKHTQFKLSTNNYNSYIECLCRTKGLAGWDEAYTLVEAEMSLPKKKQLGKPTIDYKTVNTLLSFARKLDFSSSQVDTLEKWKTEIL
ncbi:hypothetical protein K501DRAFT_322755 [Backusella circina FSU 941]|nr:hypothetical protein K501DRAFT_322755 [Backusella circina FSU 941]